MTPPVPKSLAGEEQLSTLLPILEDFEESESLFLQAIELDPEYAEAHAGLANLYDTYVFYGITATDSVEFDKYNQLRIEESKRATAIDSTLPYVNEVRGHILLNSGADLIEVYQRYLKAFELSPRSPDVLLALMDVYARRGLLHDGLALGDEALAIDPLHTWGLAWKTYALGILGDFESAVQAVNSALQINPDEIILLNNLASFHSFMKKNEEALATYERINQINPEYLKSNPYYRIKMDLLEGKQLPEAITYHPSAAILPVGNVELDFLAGDMDRFEKKFLAWWEGWKSGANTSRRSVFFYSQSSIYLHLKNHLMYQSFRHEPWFEDILSVEKEKYDRFRDAFVRPGQLLGGRV